MDTPETIELRTTSGGILAIRKDAVTSVLAPTYGGRNLKCTINGLETLEGYDFVLDALGWSPQRLSR